MSLPEIKVTGRVLTLSQSTLARNQELLGSGGSSAAATQSGVVAQPSGHSDRPAQPSRIRQSSKPLMNKLETSFWSEYLEHRYPHAKPQALKFKLGNGIAYKPDFVDLSVQPVKAWEVKGPHAFRGGFENLKVAAGLWTEVRWTLAWKKDGKWQMQEVLP